jgi:hypothetical protein
MEISMEGLKKLKIEVSYDPAIPLLCIYPKESKPAYYRDTYVTMFIMNYLQ